MDIVRVQGVVRAQWKKDQYARDASGKIGQLTMDADSDLEVKLKWADGSGESGYTKVATLFKTSKSAFDVSAPHTKPHHTTHVA